LSQKNTGTFTLKAYYW